jgi:hypothetical protein
VSNNNLAFGALWTVTGTASAKAPFGAGTPGSLGAASAGKISFSITITTNASATNTFMLNGTYTQALGSVSVGPTGSASLSPILPGALKAFDNAGNPISLTQASYTITASFVATGSDFASSLPADSASVVETVTNANTVTQLSVSPSNPPPQSGQKVTLTATVTATGGSQLQPLGSVTFKDGTATLGTVNIPVPATQIRGSNKSTATFTISTLSIGNHALSATYNGDTVAAPDFTTPPAFAAFPSVIRGQWNGSGPAVFGLAVKPLTTFGKLTAVPATQVFGSTVTFSDVVTSSTGAIPSGLVQFKDGTTVIGASSLDATGKATFSTNTLTTGVHVITAFYNAHLNFAGDTSNSLNFSVLKGTTTTKFGGSASQVVAVGGPTDITATVAAVSGTTTPTGTVVFVAESNARTAAGQIPAFGLVDPVKNPSNLAPFTMGTATLVGGVAVLSLPSGIQSAPGVSATPDIYEVEAFYSGDANSFVSNTKPVNPGPAPGPRGIEFVVQDSATDLRQVAITPASPGNSKSVDFTYQVRPSAQAAFDAAGKLTAETGGFGGTVDLIVDGSLIVHQKVLSLTGQVDLIDANLLIGTHSVTVQYNGDAGNPSVLATVGYAPYPAGTPGWLPATSVTFSYTRASADAAVSPSSSVVSALGTALRGTPAPALALSGTTPIRTSTALAATRVDGYFASGSTPTGAARTLAGALAKTHSGDDWLTGPF